MKAAVCAILAAGPGMSRAAELSQRAPDEPVESSAAAGPQTAGAQALHATPPEFTLRVTPYAWLTSFDGSLNAGGISLDLDLTFKDVLESSDSIIGLMGAIDFTSGRFIAQINGAYAKSLQESSRSRASDSNALVVSAATEVEFSSSWLEVLGGYRVLDRPLGEREHFAIDVFGGLRRTDLSLDLAVDVEGAIVLPGGESLTPGNRAELERDYDWYEPFVGARALLELQEGWTASLRGDVGGFDVDGSSFAWQTIGALGYEWAFEGGAFGLLAGYRLLGQDYREGSFEWDVLTHGPIVGCTLRFEF